MVYTVGKMYLLLRLSFSFLLESNNNEVQKIVIIPFRVFNKTKQTENYETDSYQAHKIYLLQIDTL